MLHIDLPTRLWTADVVYSGFGTPMEHGGVAVVGEHVVASGPLNELQRSYPAAVLEPKGRFLSIPTVNAHTHLDLSELQTFRGSYTAFIRYVIKSGRSGLRGLPGARNGMVELLSTGVSAVGDIVANEAVMDWWMHEAPMRGVAYWEVIEPDPTKARDVFRETRRKLLRWRKLEHLNKVRVGISPHATYTVSAPLFKLLFELAKLEGYPMQIHVAESPAERTYFLEGSGPLRQLMDREPEHMGQSPVSYLAELGVLSARPTLVHAVQVDKNDVRTIAQSGCIVVSCPRSNVGLEVGRLPWPLYAREGVEVALGTDARASVPNLDIKTEMEAALAAGASSKQVLRAATRGGYRALAMPTPHLSRGVPISQVQFW